LSDNKYECLSRYVFTDPLISDADDMFKITWTIEFDEDNIPNYKTNIRKLTYIEKFKRKLCMWCGDVKLRVFG